ncbi:cytidylate kinase, partial [Candidatus Acetothermia bacterium]
DYDETLREIIARDRRDSTRELSPLNPAPDAIIITTDQKSLTEVISEAIGLVRERLRKGDASAAGRG